MLPRVGCRGAVCAHTWFGTVGFGLATSSEEKKISTFNDCYWWGSGFVTGKMVQTLETETLRLHLHRESIFVTCHWKLYKTLHRIGRWDFVTISKCWRVTKDSFLHPKQWWHRFILLKEATSTLPNGKCAILSATLSSEFWKCWFLLLKWVQSPKDH